MAHNKHGSNSPFHSKHLYIGSPMVHALQAKKPPNQNLHMSQPYVPAINISLKNQLSINLLGKSYGSQTQREPSANKNYDLSKKVSQIGKRPSEKVYNSQKVIEPRENNFMESDAPGSVALLQKQLEKSIKPKTKSMDQYSSAPKTQQTAKPSSMQKFKVSTEPNENFKDTSLKRSDYMSNSTIMNLIQKINSHKQSLQQISKVKSPTQSEVFGSQLKKFLNDQSQQTKFVNQKHSERSSARKKSTNDEQNRSGFKTERLHLDSFKTVENTVTVLLFDLDKTVTEYKFDSLYGTTDQLLMFLQIQVQQRQPKAQVIGFQTIDRNIALDYYLHLNAKPLEPLIKQTIKLQPLTRYDDGQALSLKSFYFLQCVGMGGFSRVYLVRSRTTGRFLALKLISKQFIVENQKQSIVKNERDVMVQLSQQKCKFICKVECAFETKSWVCFGMEYCPGGELFNQLRKVKRMNEDQARIYFIQVCAAVKQLHESFVLYRDIKPENILIDENGHLKVADFGLARPNMTSEDEAYSFCGSPEYMAPEMLQQQGHTYAVDYYCLGALLYELLTGLPPYYSRDTNKIFQSILYENLNFPQGLVSAPGRDLIRKLLAKNPEERLGTIGGVDSILGHQWINQRDVIERVLEGQVEPPFPANLTSFNFDPSEFKKGEATFKSDLQKSLTSPEEQIFKPMFQDFYYVGPNLKYNPLQIEDTRRVASASSQLDSSIRNNSSGYRQDSTGQRQTASTSSSQILKKPISNFDRGSQSKQNNIQKRLQMQTTMKNQQTSLFMKSLATEPSEYSIERQQSLVAEDHLHSYRQAGKITVKKKLTIPYE